MMSKIVFLVTIGLIIVNTVAANTLKCYQCTNCDVVEDSQLQICTKDNLDVNTTTTTAATVTHSTEKYRENDNSPANGENKTNSLTEETPVIQNFSCFKIRDDGNIQRGCTRKIDNCAKLNETLGEKYECQKVCDLDGCNPATNIPCLELRIIVFIIFAKMLLY